MIIAFKTDKTEALDIFLSDFQEPPGTIARITHEWIYTAKKVYRFEDGVVVIKSDSFIELLSMYAIVGILGGFFIGLMLGWNGLIYFSIPFLVLLGFINSPRLHYMQAISKLKRYGHDKKVYRFNYFQAKMRIKNAEAKFTTSNN